MATLLQNNGKGNELGCFRPVSWWALGVLLVSLILIHGYWLPPALAATQPAMAAKEVTAIFSRLQFNRATGTFDTVATLKNNSAGPVPGPLSLIITGINPSSVTLANATGTLSGMPYSDVPVTNNILEAGAITTVVLQFNNPSRMSFTFTRQVAWDPQVVLSYILNSDQVSQEYKQALQDIYAAFQAHDPERGLDLIETHFGGPIQEYFNASTFDSNGNKIPFEIPDTAKLADTPKEYYNILTTAGAAGGYYKYPFDPLYPPPPYYPSPNLIDITHTVGSDDVALVDEKMNPLTASQVKRFLYGHTVLENGQGMTKFVSKRVSGGGGYAPNILGSDSSTQSPGLNAYEWRDLVTNKTGLYCDIIYFLGNGSYTSYPSYNFKTKSGNSNEKYTGLFQLVDCTSYQPVSIPLFMVLSQSNDTSDFASIITSKPPKKAVIYTHGTLLYHWMRAPFFVAPQWTIYENNFYLDNGYRNIKQAFDEYSLGKDFKFDFYKLEWNGGNKTYYRSHAAEKLKNLIYAITANNLYNLEATEIYLVSHSHGTSVSSLAINAIDLNDLELLYGKIEKLISFAGVARQFEYIQQKIRQINYNRPDKYEGDGVVPRAWNDNFPFGDPEDDPCLNLPHGVLEVCHMTIGLVVFLSELLYTELRVDGDLYYFQDKSPLAVDVDVKYLFPNYQTYNWHWWSPKKYRLNHETMILDYGYAQPIIWDALLNR